MAKPRRKRFELEGFEPLYSNGKRDSKRRYLNEATGEVLTRSEFEAQATKVPLRAGYHHQSYVIEQGGAIKRAHQQGVYQQRLEDYVRHTNKIYADEGSDVRITKNIARQTADFKVLYASYKNSRDRAKGGLRHQALIYFEIIDIDDDYY